MYETAKLMYVAEYKNQGSKLVELILEDYSGSLLRCTLFIAKIFPREALRYFSGIFLNVNWLKVTERKMPMEGIG